MECEICLEQYNKGKNKPYTILPCTHSFCVQCLTKLKKKSYKCPKCDKKITGEVPCYVLLNLLELNLQPVSVTSSSSSNLSNKKNNLLLDDLIKEPLQLKCEQKIVESQEKMNLMKEKINKNTSDLINRILIQQDELIKMLEKTHQDLKLNVNKILNETNNINEIESKLIILNEIKFNYENNNIKDEFNLLPSFSSNDSTTSSPATKNNLLISGATDKCIKIWNMDTGDCVKTLEGHESSITAIKATSNQFLISASDDHAIKIWNLKNDQCIQTLSNHPNWFNRFEFISNDILISTGLDDERLIRIWDFKTGKCVRNLVGHQDSIWCLKVFSKDIVVSGSNDSIIKAWNYNTGDCVKTFIGHLGRISCFEFVSSS
jgi:WD40 repeat protein